MSTTPQPAVMFEDASQMFASRGLDRGEIAAVLTGGYFAKVSPPAASATNRAAPMTNRVSAPRAPSTTAVLARAKQIQAQYVATMHRPLDLGRAIARARFDLR